MRFTCNLKFFLCFQKPIDCRKRNMKRILFCSCCEKSMFMTTHYSVKQFKERKETVIFLRILKSAKFLNLEGKNWDVKKKSIMLLVMNAVSVKTFFWDVKFFSIISLVSLEKEWNNLFVFKMKTATP